MEKGNKFIEPKLSLEILFSYQMVWKSQLIVCSTRQSMSSSTRVPSQDKVISWRKMCIRSVWSNEWIQKARPLTWSVGLTWSVEKGSWWQLSWGKTEEQERTFSLYFQRKMKMKNLKLLYKCNCKDLLVRLEDSA